MRSFEGRVRLVGGGQAGGVLYGTVLVFRAGQWGTVLDYGWDWRDAVVVCRQLGWTSGTASWGSEFGGGSGPVWVSNVRCGWFESSILNCASDGWSGIHNSGNHDRDAGVRCYNATVGSRPPTDGALRLVGVNASAGVGTLEIWYSGTWGGIYSDGAFHWRNAAVACRQLGWLTGTGVSMGFLGGGSESQVLWMSGLNCAGTESRLVDCQNGGLYERAGYSSLYGAGVVCSNETRRYGDLRLVGPEASSGLGVVEVWVHNAWGSIFTNEYSKESIWMNAVVACRQLGWAGGAPVSQQLSYGSTTLITWHIRSRCATWQWNTSRLMDCAYDSPGAYGEWRDGHAYDMKVRCNNDTQPPEGTIRLVPHSFYPTPGAGALQIWFNGMWSYLQLDNLNWAAALAACRELGYTAGRPLSYAVMGPAYGKSQCGGNRRKRAGQENEARDFRFVVDPPDHTYDAGVQCTNDTLPPYGTLRLARSQRADEGQVEIRTNESWSVLGFPYRSNTQPQAFSHRDAVVACRQMGYFTGRVILQNNHHVGRDAPLWMPRVSLWKPNYGWYASFGCAGHEASLLGCRDMVAQIYRTRLGYYQDYGFRPVTLRCANTTEAPEGTVRLAGGSTRTSGRVEVMQHGQWGGVCQYGFGWRQARAVCRHLGYTSGKPVYGDTYGLPDPEPAQGSLRLVGGPVAWIGRLEIFNEGAWGTICRVSSAPWRTDFKIRQARVACRQLGYRGGRIYGTLLTGSGRYRQPDKQPTWLRDIECSGSEARLDACAMPAGFDENSCGGSHDSDVVIACEPKAVAGVPEPAAGAVRLAGGPNSWSGRVEVFYDGLWGTIGRITTNEARVICTQLGLTGGRVSDSLTTYGTGHGPVWLSGFSCQGTEANITQCAKVVWDGEAASHEYDAGVMCYPPAGAVVAEYTLAAGSQDAGLLGIWQDGLPSTHLLAPIPGGVSQPMYWLPGGSTAYGCQPTPGNASAPWFFVGARLRVHNNNGTGDDTGVTGIEFLCSNNLTAPVQSPPIGNADVGAWQARSQCPAGSAICGYQLRALPYQCYGAEGQCDDVGVTGMRISCCKVTRDHYPGPGRSIRLHGGSSPMDGRVEFLGRETWNISTIYQSGWTLMDARVICKQLGFGAGIPRYANQYGFGNDDVAATVFLYIDQPTLTFTNDWERGQASRFTDFQCTGEEAALLDCPYGTTLIEVSNNAAGVVCSADLLEPEYGSVRLMNGPAPYAGRVEMYANGGWQAIRADDDWDLREANVVCRQLGFASALRPIKLSSVWSVWMGTHTYVDTTPLQLGGLQCNGTEAKLTACPASLISSSNDAGSSIWIDHSADAGVVCQSAAAPARGALRLRDSPVASEGRIELYWDFAWGTISPASYSQWYFNRSAATAACRQLGYKSGRPTYMSGWGGFVDSVSASEAGTMRYSQSAPNWLSGGLACTGAEWTVAECPGFAPAFTHNYIDWADRSFDVGVLCSVDLPPAPGTLRLSGGPGPHAGLLEVAYRGEWGAVLGLRYGAAAASWGGKESAVACRQLGYAGVAGYWHGSDTHTGWQSGEAWLSGYPAFFLYNVSCAGNETSLAKCAVGDRYVITAEAPYVPEAGTYHSHVFLMCSEAPNPPLGSLRLVGGPAPNMGALEVFADDYRWRSVLQATTYGAYGMTYWATFGTQEAGVACRQMGFFTNPVTGNNTKGILLTGNGFMASDPANGVVLNVQCNGTERNLTQCGPHWYSYGTGVVVGLLCGSPIR
ncbi:hypothetical protein GPECTOR_8g367 [Gonium pectorale]|uniref:SRCR domain-containing protein n=1 Tax=Gonium pectorale TaxID=33097 RepID=A0A150GT25_GONPE|nr:hypothetical protein GPECTOR_8g367 [Gonium pectorale]|eukprot:KXZ52997.1 hypothetical protein GPECTOR_8g367 [Gonium pectorale]